MTKNDRRFPAVADVVVMLILFLLVQVGVGAVLHIFGISLPDSLPYDSTDIETYVSHQVALGERVAIVYPISMLLALAAVWIYMRIRGGKGLKIRLSVAGFNPNIILAGTLWVLAAQVLLEPLSMVLPGGGDSGVGRGFWACITSLVVAPVLEELLCRGVVLESVCRGWGSKVAVLVSALFFGIIHVEPATMVVAVVVGAILGVIYLRTASLFSVILIHSINNAAALALIYIGIGGETLYDIVGGGVMYYIIYVVAALLFALMTFETVRRTLRKREKKSNE